MIDPRHTETARLATRFLSPAPASDWVLLAHLVRELLDGADVAFLDEHASGVERLRAAVARRPGA